MELQETMGHMHGAPHLPGHVQFAAFPHVDKHHAGIVDEFHNVLG
jgi:hypothetical protein